MSEILDDELYEIETCSYFDLEEILDFIKERYPSRVYTYSLQSSPEYLCQSNDIAVLVSNDADFLPKLFDAVRNYKNDYIWVKVNDKYVENEVNK